jgi:hypothetical protein
MAEKAERSLPRNHLVDLLWTNASKVHVVVERNDFMCARLVVVVETEWKGGMEKWDFQSAWGDVTAQMIVMAKDGDG